MALLLLLLLLSRLCTNSPRGTGAGVIIGSMAASAKKRKRERREGLEYGPADAYENLVGARRCVVAFQLQAITMGESL